MNKVGLYGLGVMGTSLAENIYRHGFSLSVYNIEVQKAIQFAKNKDGVMACESLEAFVNSLAKPRVIILMVTAGKAVDEVIASLLPYLQQEDCIIDCGNSFYLDSEKRQQELEQKGIHFISAGVSGGERGALLGPSIMPSGNRSAYQNAAEVLETIAAHNSDGSSCCHYIGIKGCGHFVKMVHNGIEYADMQLLADAYALLRFAYADDTEQIASIFAHYQSGMLSSYLMEITASILRYQEWDGTFLIHHILDVAKQKGTGKWVVQTAIEEGIAVPSIEQAVSSRFLSEQKNLRNELAAHYEKKQQANPYDTFIKELEEALYFMKIMIYAQGFAFMQRINEKNGYGICFHTLATIWQEGCIIKSAFLKTLAHIYDEQPDLEHLLLAKPIQEKVQSYEASARNVVAYAVQNGISIPLMMSALSYYDAIRCADSTTALLQAQRDYFGAHTYERNDRKGVFHTIWE